LFCSLTNEPPLAQALPIVTLDIGSVQPNLVLPEAARAGEPLPVSEDYALTKNLRSLACLARDEK
jgi:hypothetical protein